MVVITWEYRVSMCLFLTVWLSKKGKTLLGFMYVMFMRALKLNGLDEHMQGYGSEIH